MAHVREAMAAPTGGDRGLWERMAGELGLPGLTVPEDYGGAGLGQVELSVVMEELGRALTPSPFLASAVLAASALLATDDEDAKRELLPGIAGGTTVATLAVAEAGGGWDPASVGMRAALEDGAWTLTGAKTLVPDGATADLVLVAARAGDELGLFAVEGGAAGLTRTGLTTLDPTRRLARLELAATPARRLVSEDAAGALSHALDLAAVALAAEQLGGLQRCLDLSVDYAKNRYQFGRAIGSFQAIQHTLADVAVALDGAQLLARKAAWALDGERADARDLAAMALLFASEHAQRATERVLHFHGGYGFMQEYDIQLYYRRAKGWPLVLDSPSSECERLAARWYGAA
jgi:alkylation response protein AidB-like acyl-CoA dehydrogenase